MDLWVLVIGLLGTIVALAITGRRVRYLFRLITSGQPAPDRVAGVTKRLGRAVATQVVEVFGQKKLLKWSIPGAAHFFVFWAFLILGTVYLEAYGILLSRNPEWAIPVVGHWDLLGFAQDFIAIMALVGIITFAAIRLRETPGEARPQVALLGLAPGRRLAGAVHDLQRHLDAVPLPRRVSGRRQLPVRRRRLRLERARQTSCPTPRPSRASACSSTSASCWCSWSTWCTPSTCTSSSRR